MTRLPLIPLAFHLRPPFAFVPTAAVLAILVAGPAPAAGAQSGGRLAPTARAETPSAGSRAPHVVTVVTRDFAFEMPDTIPAGVTTLRLRNDGREPHHLMLYRLEPGRGLPAVRAALDAGGAHPEWMHPVGGPNAVVGTDVSVGTLLLAPGQYVAFCHVVSPDRVDHFAKGMLKLVTVARVPRVAATRAAEPGAPSLPAANLTITLSEYGFRFSRPPTRGRQRIAVTNAGRQPHELILSRLDPHKTSADFVRWIDTQEGPPPVRPYGGATDLPPGGTMVLDVDLKPGRYSAVCRVRDAVDGQPHDRHGMTADFVVR